MFVNLQARTFIFSTRTIWVWIIRTKLSELILDTSACAHTPTTATVIVVVIIAITSYCITGCVLSKPSPVSIYAFKRSYWLADEFDRKLIPLDSFILLGESY